MKIQGSVNYEHGNSQNGRTAHWARLRYAHMETVAGHESELSAQRSALAKLRARMREDLNMLERAAEALDKLAGHG